MSDAFSIPDNPRRLLAEATNTTSDPFLASAQSLLANNDRTENAPSTPGLPLTRVNYRPLSQARAPISTGVRRMDELLGGGYPSGSAVILYGPPFCGKQQLQQQAVANAAAQGIPCTLLLHAISARAMSERLRLHDPTLAAAEAAGLLAYVDIYSHFLGEPEDHPNATYVRDPTDLAAVLAAFEAQQSRMLTRPDQAHVVAIESMSTMLVDSGANRTFAFLRTVLGRTIHRGGVALMCLEADMHPESDVQMAKHLSSGILELRKKGEARALRVEGLETSYPRAGWIEYEFSTHSFRLTGGFSARTIR